MQIDITLNTVNDLLISQWLPVMLFSVLREISTILQRKVNKVKKKIRRHHDVFLYRKVQQNEIRLKSIYILASFEILVIKYQAL